MLPGLDYTVIKSSSNGMIQEGDVICYEDMSYTIKNRDTPSLSYQDIIFNKKASNFEVEFLLKPSVAREIRKEIKHRFSIEEAIELCQQMAYQHHSQYAAWKYNTDYNPRKAVLFLQIIEWLEMLNSKKFRKVTTKRKEVL